MIRRFSPKKVAMHLVWSYEIAGSHDLQHQSYPLAVVSFYIYRMPRGLIETTIAIQSELVSSNYDIHIK